MEETTTSYVVAIYYGDKTEYVGHNNTTSSLVENGVYYVSREEAESALKEARDTGDASGWQVTYGIEEVEY